MLKEAPGAMKTSVELPAETFRNEGTVVLGLPLLVIRFGPKELDLSHNSELGPMAPLVTA